MRLDPKQTAAQTAGRLLPRRARKFFESGDIASMPGRKAEEVHRFRVQTKRFRYSLEYFRSCYGPVLESYLEPIKDLQQALGDWNDYHATGVFLKKLLGSRAPRSLGAEFWAVGRKRQAELRAKFRARWRKGFRDETFRRRFLRYLASPRARRS